MVELLTTPTKLLNSRLISFIVSPDKISQINAIKKKDISKKNLPSCLTYSAFDLAKSTEEICFRLLTEKVRSKPCQSPHGISSNLEENENN